MPYLHLILIAILFPMVSAYAGGGGGGTDPFETTLIRTMDCAIRVDGREVGPAPFELAFRPHGPLQSREIYNDGHVRVQMTATRYDRREFYRIEAGPLLVRTRGKFGNPNRVTIANRGHGTDVVVNCLSRGEESSKYDSHELYDPDALMRTVECQGSDRFKERFTADFRDEARARRSFARHTPEGFAAAYAADYPARSESVVMRYGDYRVEVRSSIAVPLNLSVKARNVRPVYTECHSLVHGALGG